MKLSFIYQYISLNQEVLKIIQTLRKCPKAGIIPILEIEDSLQIPLDPVKTALLKSRAPEALKSILSYAIGQDLNRNISFRINANDTKEFGLDINMLHELKPFIKWGSLFIPKVNSEEVLAEYIKSLDGIDYEELVVLAESKSFFDNYTGIIELCKSERIKKSILVIGITFMISGNLSGRSSATWELNRSSAEKAGMKKPTISIFSKPIDIIQYPWSGKVLPCA